MNRDGPRAAAAAFSSYDKRFGGRKSGGGVRRKGLEWPAREKEKERHGCAGNYSGNGRGGRSSCLSFSLHCSKRSRLLLLRPCDAIPPFLPEIELLVPRPPGCKNTLLGRKRREEINFPLHPDCFLPEIDLASTAAGFFKGKEEKRGGKIDKLTRTGAARALPSARTQIE